MLIRLISSIIYVVCFIYVILHNNPTIFYLFISILILGSVFEVIKFKNMPFRNIARIFLIIYITTSLLLLIKINLIENGELLLLILLSQVWATDLGGYLVGSVVGKFYFSTISPNKTYEGLIGSMVFCLTTGLIAQKLTSHIEINTIQTSFIICSSFFMSLFICF